MSDWTELKDLQAVAKAQADGWEIEVRHETIWLPWQETGWGSASSYRGRPKAARKVVRVREAVMEVEGEVWVQAINENYAATAAAFQGWVKGSEWVEKEYE